MKKIFFITAFLLSVLTVLGQSEYTALQYSTTDFGGTSRYNGMAGAFGALGGDVSTLSVNPAGIGLFRRSEFSLTPAFQINKVESTYLNTSADDIKANFNMNNIAYVLSSPVEDDGWRNVSFGISYNRVKDFSSNEVITGSNAPLTFADQLATFAGGISSENFETTDPIFLQPAWNTYIIDPIEGENELYQSNFVNNNVRQVYNKENSGRIGETDIAFGANYNDKLYLGVTLGFSSIKHEESINYTEAAIEELDTAKLANYSINETRVTDGDGFSAKIGMIYRVNNNVRAGLAFHSPNFMTFTTEQSTNFSSVQHDGVSYNHSSPTLINEYNISSPSRVIASLAFLMGKKGLLDVDYEYVNYGNMRLRNRGANTADYSLENQAIGDVFESTHNVRVGGELRLQPFHVRLGTAYYQNPNVIGNVVNTDDMLIHTAGVGYKKGNMYLDMAYRLTNSVNDFNIYSPAFSEVATQRRTGNSVSLTWGIRF